ncbi:MAG: hypothetical protein JRI22_22750 [Deltaproteobacteria bacterium]|nr:hypothetical protein [Deltaproteobacteria bacterium]
MKIYVMDEVYSQPGLQVMDCAWIEAPLDAIIEQGICSNHGLAMPGINWRVKQAGWSHPGCSCPAPVCFRDDGEKYRLNEALVFYSSFSDLVEFIAEKIDPEGEGSLSGIAAMARSCTGRVDRSLIEDVLNEGPRRRRPPRYARKERNLPLEKLERHERMDLVPVSCQGKIFRAWSLLRFMSVNVIFALEEFKELNGHRLPRFILAKPLTGTGRPRESIDELDLLAFDGDRHLLRRSLGDLPPAMLADLDLKGAMYYLKKLIPEVGSCIEDRTPPHPCLANPALAFDSHYPVQLPADIEVVDTPEAALWFLSRTVKGIFIPGQTGRMFPVSRIPERESFQLLTRPRRLSA